MPPSRGATIYFDKSRQQYQIRDKGGFIKRLDKARVADLGAAQKELAVYIASKKPDKVAPRLEIDEDIASNPKLVMIAEVLAHYGEAQLGTSNAELVGYHIPRLLDFWGEKTLSQIRASSCDAYVEHRTSMVWYSPGAKTGKPVSDQTAARELDTLSAAIGVWHREHNLVSVPLITKPQKADAFADWLTEIEYQRLVKAAQGYLWAASDIATREPIWERDGRPQPHLERFIHIGYFQGSRHGGILKQRWTPGRLHGYYDFHTMTCHRTGPAVKQTRKRETPCRIHDRLFPMLVAWKAADVIAGVDHVIAVDGEPIGRINQSFKTAVLNARLEYRQIDGSKRDELPTPHILRHTRATLLLGAGVSVRDVGEYLGLSEKMVRDVYGHTHVEYQRHAASAA